MFEICNMKVEDIKYLVHDFESFMKSSAKYCICDSEVYEIPIKQCLLGCFSGRSKHEKKIIDVRL